ncbi:reverse transcriptase domain-containing protein [Chlorogloeopsis fritschii]|nr:reverse transcriptase domain-containing protein [Chlorogloeopsis fritschii]
MAGCFDNISHQALLRKTKAPPIIQRILRGWLKCGVMDGVFQPIEAGTPQGGVISPLLANIALHGLEEQVHQIGTKTRPTILLVRYADDFVAFANNESDIERAKYVIENWLKGIGLELKPEKTNLSHTLNGKAGFNFLGFNVRQYPVGKYSSKRGYKTIIKPSKKSENQHSAKLRNVVTQFSAGKQEDLINCLNPIIIGWCNYYSTVVSKDIFSSLYDRLFYKLIHWAKRRHPHLNSREAISRYWAVDRGGGWVFQAKSGTKLRKHSETPIVRHVRVKGDKSPFDGDWTYWSKRRGTYPGIPPLVSSLLKTQKGKCSYCGLDFMPEDLTEIHHCDGNHNNNKRENLALLHRHCHDQAHGLRDKPQN